MYALLFPILDCPSSRTPQEQWAACNAQGPSEVNCPSLVRDGHVFCYFACFCLVGFLVEETPCEHGENMQTPHRKAHSKSWFIKGPHTSLPYNAMGSIAAPKYFEPNSNGYFKLDRFKLKK